MAKRVVIVGGGFAGLNAAKRLGRTRDVDVTLIDRKNHHLFQPLLYQVATAGLSPADIAAPIRNILSGYQNVEVLLGEVQSVDLVQQQVHVDIGSLRYDYLLLACGARHSYFGQEQWSKHAPGLKTIEEATDIRRRILTAYEIAERADDPDEQRKQLTFVVIGGGPTGVEMAGAIGEMSRFALARDFRNINSKSTRVFLMEAGDRILSGFDKTLSERAARDLEKLGVQIWTSSRVTEVDGAGVSVGSERIEAATVIWAAGVQASSLGTRLYSDVNEDEADNRFETDRNGRLIVNDDLSLASYTNVFVAGDQAHVEDKKGEPLPGVAPVATQQGRHVATMILADINQRARAPFRYVDKGTMATIGRHKAVMQVGTWKFGGRFAWLTWWVVHIYFLTGFRNRFFVFLSWIWSYLTYRRGARLIVGTKVDGNKKTKSVAEEQSKHEALK
ncbi:MAG: NAD(P)/FAD-dependent oxidoreductase [Planctomycetota bacterium]